jgi:hypothetical protein
MACPEKQYATKPKHKTRPEESTTLPCMTAVATTVSTTTIVARVPTILK